MHGSQRARSRIPACRRRPDAPPGSNGGALSASLADAGSAPRCIGCSISSVRGTWWSRGSCCQCGLLTRHGHQVVGPSLCMWTVSVQPCTPHRQHHLTFLSSCGDITSYALVTVPIVMGSGTKCTVESGKTGPPPHSRRRTGMTCSANRCICSSTSSVLYPPPSNHAVKKKSS